MRSIKAENARPMNDANQTKGTGKEVLNAQPQKTAPIIDADFQQARQIAAARLARKQATRGQMSPIVEA
jgi:hypothetical protein